MESSSSPVNPPSIFQTDPRFLIVDKPAGWLVHPTRPDGTFTLIDWLREQHPGEFLSLVSDLTEKPRASFSWPGEKSTLPFG